MKRLLAYLFIVLSLGLTVNAYAKPGKGEIKLEPWAVDYFIKYIRGKHRNAPELFIISNDSSWATYYYCGSGAGNCSGTDSQGITLCEIKSGTDCGLFARGRIIKWKNGINKAHWKKSHISSKWSDAEIRAKLTELGFLGGSKPSSTTTTSKITKKSSKVEKKKETKKLVKKYELKGERSIALSWEGYEELIAGTVNFDETDYKGTLNLPLPNNDGTCDGTYSLQKGGKGTWQIACSNNMGAAGTLKWVKGGGVTGTGRDHNDKKVKFTVSRK